MNIYINLFLHTIEAISFTVRVVRLNTKSQNIYFYNVLSKF